MAGFMSDLAKGFMSQIAGPAAGPSAADTSSAYAQLQQAINQDYSQQKKNFETNPDNKGKSWTPPSAQERLRDQIDAMVLSGNPMLQQRGIQLIGTIKPGDKTAFAKDYELLKGENPELKAMDVYNKLHPGRAQTNINVNTQGQEKPIPINELTKLVLPSGEPVPYGTTPSQAKKLGAKLVQSAAQTKTGTSTEIMGNSLKVIKDNIDTSSDNPIDAAAAEVRSQPGVVGSVANLALTASGKNAKVSDVKFNQATRQLTGVVTNLMNGAGASDTEREYWASLQPKFTDDVNTRKIKYNQMVDFAASMAERAKQSGVRGVPDFTDVTKFDIPSEDKGLPQLPAGFKWDD